MSIRHGSLPIISVMCIALAAEGAPPDHNSEVVAVNSRDIEISYSVHQAAKPIERVDLWVTTDRAESWRHHGVEPSGGTATRFHADRDGVYGFYLVLRNSVGLSSGPPRSGQEPHQWALIDSAPPLVQIKQAQVVKHEPPRDAVLVVSWAAYDDHLGDRPISLYYQTTDQPRWRLMAARVADVGRFDWTVPRNLMGRITIKIEITDRAGNMASDTSRPVLLDSTVAGTDLLAQPQPPAMQGVDSPAGQSKPALSIGKPERTVSPLNATRSRELHELGLWHKDRGEYALAVERLIEAMNLNPNVKSPAYDLAEIYYLQGNYQGALDIHGNILEKHHADRRALRDSALAMMALSKYPEALRQLERVLQSAPNDAQIWLDAGDVLLSMSQPAQARSYWQEAARLTPTDSTLAGRAKKRLAKYGLPQE
ncbi:MAG: tetratricopeptide repeat protein [Hyphomicrobium sp.]